MAVQSDRAVIVSIRADVTDLRRGLSEIQEALRNQQSSISGMTNSMGHGFEKMFMYGMMVKMAFNDITQGVNGAVAEFATLESINRKFNTVFKETRKQVLDFTKTFSQGTGIAQADILKTVNNLGDLALGLGINEKATAVMSTSLAGLGYDLAQFNYGQISLEDTMRNLNSAMLGEGEAAKSLGVAMNETTLKSALLSLGIKENYQDLDEGSKYLARYAVMWQFTQQSQGYAIRNADSLASTMTRLTSSLTQTKQAVGQALAPMYMTFAKIMMAYVLPSTVQFTRALGSFFQSVSDGGAGLYALIGVMTALTGVITYALTSWVMAKMANIVANNALTVSTVRTAWAMLTVQRSVGGAITALRGLQINVRAVAMSMATMISTVIMMFSMFQSSKSFKMPKVEPPKMIDPKELQKIMNKTNAVQKKGAKAQKTYAQKIADAEKKVTEEIKKQIKERTKIYSNLGKFMQGVDRQTLGMNNILKGAKSSANALKDFNGAIKTLQDRIGNSDIGQQFLAQLNQLDPDEYVDYVRSLATASDAQLKEIVDLWGQRHKEAGERAEAEIQAQAPDIRDTIYNSISLDDNVLNQIGDEMATGVADGLTQGFEGISDDLANTLGDELSTSFGDAFSGLRGMTIGSMIGGLIGGVVGSIVPTIGTMVGMQIGAMLGGAIGMAFGDYFATAWTEWLNRLKVMVKNITTNFKQTKESEGLGIAIVEGILAGMGTAMATIVDFIWINTVKPIIDGVKKLFGIHSPSRVMRDQVGVYLAQGIIEGFGNTSGLWTVVENWKKTISEYWKGTTLYSIGTGLAESLRSGLSNAGSVGENIATQLKNSFIGSVNKIIDAFNNMIRYINSKLTFVVPGWVPGIGGQYWGMNLATIPNVSYYANGGIVDKATLGVFGEAGTEANIPLGNLNKMRPFAEAVAKFMDGGTGGSGVTVQNLIVREEADVKKIAEQLYSLAKSDRRAFGLR